MAERKSERQLTKATVIANGVLELEVGKQSDTISGFGDPMPVVDIRQAGKDLVVTIEDGREIRYVNAPMELTFSEPKQPEPEKKEPAPEQEDKKPLSEEDGEIIIVQPGEHDTMRFVEGDDEELGTIGHPGASEE